MKPDGLSAAWRVETAGPNWRVSTTYEFLRWDDLVAADMARPFWVRVVLMLRCFGEHLGDGTLLRVARGSWRFCLVYLTSVAVLLARAVVPLLVLLLVTGSLGKVAGVPVLAALVAGLSCGALAHVGLKALDHRAHASQLCDNWLLYRDWVRGRRADFDARIDVMARILRARMSEAAHDELLLVGHSAGGSGLICALARALEYGRGEVDASLPRAIALGLGSSLPLAALQPRGHKLREAIRRVATERSVLWIDGQARKDVVNFGNFDPVAGVGLLLGPERRNPLIWRLRFRDMLAPASYNRMRWRFMRMHYQFIMGNDRRAAYDYLMFVCGPAPLAHWAQKGAETLGRFSADGSYNASTSQDERAMPLDQR